MTFLIVIAGLVVFFVGLGFGHALGYKEGRADRNSIAAGKAPAPVVRKLPVKAVVVPVRRVVKASKKPIKKTKTSKR